MKQDSHWSLPPAFAMRGTAWHHVSQPPIAQRHGRVMVSFLCYLGDSSTSTSDVLAPTPLLEITLLIAAKIIVRATPNYNFEQLVVKYRACCELLFQ